MRPGWTLAHLRRWKVVGSVLSAESQKRFASSSDSPHITPIDLDCDGIKGAFSASVLAALERDTGKAAVDYLIAVRQALRAGCRLSLGQCRKILSDLPRDQPDCLDLPLHYQRAAVAAVCVT